METTATKIEALKAKQAKELETLELEERILAAFPDFGVDRRAHVYNLHGETAAPSQVVAAIEAIKPAARGTITVDDQGIAMPTTLDDTAIQRALGGVPRTSMAEGIAGTMARFEELQQAGRLDLSDLHQ